MPFQKEHMGLTAKESPINIIFREKEQDKFAVESQTTHRRRLGSRKIRRRNSSRSNSSKKRRPDCFQKKTNTSDRKTTLEALSKLKPAFKKDERLQRAMRQALTTGHSLNYCSFGRVY
jgi:acetyl-CoA C-acetyltransferase